MFRKFFTFLLFFGSLQATLKNPGNEAITEGDPMSTVCDCVNLLTGDFVGFSEDHVIDGARPLRICRSYASGNGKGEYGGWEFFPHTELKALPFRKKSKKFKQIIAREPHGTRIAFKRPNDKTAFRTQTGEFHVDFEKNGKGVTNTARGEISARTNIRNYSLHQLDDERIHLYCADGTQRNYRFSHKDDTKYRMPVFLLEEEIHPDGHHTFYQYDSLHRLEMIEKKNKNQTETYSWCRFHYKPKTKSRDFRITTSDGRVLSYEFLCKGKSDKHPRFFLKHFEGPQRPSESIEYNKKHDDTDHLVETRSLPEGRELKALYYSPEYYSVDRVETILQSMGQGDLVPTHQFKYRLTKNITEVLDYNGNKTEIKYTSDFLPIEVNFFDGDALHHSYRSIWDERGQLRIKIIKNGDDDLLTKKYEYDEKGNVVKETISCNITRKSSNDTYQTFQKYDDLNRLVQKREPSGLITKITYHNQTPLIAKKIITDKKTIHLREFYIYDQNNNYTGKIEDDAASDDDPSNLAGATFRKGQFITLKKENPGLDLPETIEEYACNLDTKEWILLTKTRLEYNKEAKVVLKEIYDTANQLLSSVSYQYTKSGQIELQKDPLGRSTTFEYDLNGNLIRQIDPDLKQTIRTYDKANRLIEEKELAPNNDIRITKHEYDHGNNKILTIDPFGNKTSYRYDSFGNVIAITHPNGATETFAYDTFGNATTYTDPLGNQTHKTYNTLGKPLETIYPDGSTETFEYTLDGHLKTHTNQEGLTLRFTYDPLGRKTSIAYYSPSNTQIATETFTYNSLHLLAHTDKEGIITTYEYDPTGREKARQRGTLRTEYEYDSLGRLTKEIQVDDINPLITTCEYNSLSQIVKQTQQDHHGKILTSESYSYDTRGNRTQTKKTKFQEIDHYDTFNRIILHENGEGYRTITAYDENYQNGDGQNVLRCVVTDPLGYKTILIYDPMMKLVSKQIQTPSFQTLFFEEYLYDLSGNCRTQKCHIYEDTAYITILLITKEYDAMNRVVQVTETDGKTTHYSYTPAGKLFQTTKPDSTILTYTYDPLSNLIELTSSDGTIHYTYSYDLNANLLRSDDHIQQTATLRTYDPLSNLLAETLANKLTISNHYDARGRRTQLQLPSTTIAYTYNALYLTQVATPDDQTLYDYDADGNLIRRGNTTYRYDRCCRPIQLQSPHFIQAIQYDPGGHITEMIRENTTHRYTYDGLGQLLGEKNHTYTYDSYYNRKSIDAIPYTTSPAHALLAAGPTEFTYDANGNPLTKSTTRYKYDALDRLIEASTPTHHITFTYDSFNRRMTKTVRTENSTTHYKYLYDNQREIGAYANNTLQELRIVGLHERDALLLLLHGKTYIPTQDLQGNTVRLDGPQTHTFQYTAFAEEHPATSPNPWRYASKRCDPETGLVYFGHRYYDPETARWLTPDPSALTDSANLYAYTYNNPFLYIDAYGLLSWPTQQYDRNYHFDLTRPPPAPSEMKFIPFEETATQMYRNMHAVEGISSLYAAPCPYTERSSVFSLGRPEVPDRKIIYVNGILNDYKEAYESAKYISDLAGGVNVEGIHVATFGFKLDCAHARILQNYGITEPVQLTRDRALNYFENSSPTATLLFLLFSNGNSVTRNSLLSDFPEEYRKRICILSLGPATHIDPQLAAAVRAFASSKDPMPNLDTYGKKHFGHNLTLLPPHPDANQHFDHAIRSPTLRDTIRNNLKIYLTKGEL